MRFLLLLLAGCAAKAPVVSTYVPTPMPCGYVADSIDEERLHRARHEAIDHLRALVDAEL